MDINRRSNLFQEVEDSVIRKIFLEKLHITQVLSIELISGGLFNTTYKIECGQKAFIIRFSPINEHLVMGFEKHLMAAENFVYSLCRKHQIICPEVVVCDTTRKLLNRDYIITSYIPGTVMLNAELSDAEREKMFEDMGEYAKKLHSVTSDRFGFVSRILTEDQTFTWAECLIREADEIVASLNHGGYLTSEEVKCIKNIFYGNRELLDEIKTPHLLHTDLWEGNVIIAYQNKTPFIKAIIDCDRAVFGDIDFEWAAPWMDIPGIYKGAGIHKKEFMTPHRKTRRQIYRIFYALMNCYVGAYEYRDMDMFSAAKKEIQKVL